MCVRRPSRLVARDGGPGCGCGCWDRRREAASRSGTAAARRAARSATAPGPAAPRTQSSIAVSADYRRWFLINASPDVRAQIEAFPALHPRDGRSDAAAGGAAHRRRARPHARPAAAARGAGPCELHATPAVHETLCDGTSVCCATLERYCPVDWRPVVPGVDVSLGDGLSYRAFDVPTTKRARFGPGSGAGPGRGLPADRRAQRTGRWCTCRGCRSSRQRCASSSTDCACLLIDGTCWHDDELIRLGLAGKTVTRRWATCRSTARTAASSSCPSLPIERKIYIHINNTNPILLDDAPERRIVEDAAWRWPWTASRCEV